MPVLPFVVPPSGMTKSERVKFAEKTLGEERVGYQASFRAFDGKSVEFGIFPRDENDSLGVFLQRDETGATVDCELIHFTDANGLKWFQAKVRESF